MKHFSWIAALALCCLVPLSACDSGGGVKEAEEPTQSKSTASARKKKKSDFVPVSEKGKKWGGWRWKGKSDDCFYLAKNRCFTEFKPACAAAKCGDKACESYGAAPISVICEGEKRPKIVRDDGDDDGGADEAKSASEKDEKKSDSKSLDEADDGDAKPKKKKKKKRKRKKKKRKKKSED